MEAAAAAAAATRYHGVARLPDGRWRGYITNKEDKRYDVGHFDTAEEAALAHDRAILAILGSDASTAVFNFRAAFSDTELRFLKGRHAPARAGVVIGRIVAGTYDAELARFAERAFDAYMDPELALDVMAFRFTHRDVLDQRKVAAVAGVTDPAARAAAERGVEREAFLEASRNKARDEAWVRSFHRRQQQVGATFDDENRWPPVLPPINVDVGDSFTGNELIYLPHGSCYVDEMAVF